MDRSTGLLKPMGERRTNSHRDLSVEESENPGTLRRWKSVSNANLEQQAKIKTTNSFWSQELLYKVTDVVLVTCALIFILSSIASIIIWWYGLPQAKGPIVFKHRHS